MRLIDVDSLVFDIPKGCRELDFAVRFCRAIKDAPTINAVTVVRCGECEHWNGETHGCVRNPSIEPWFESDYCSYGEGRK